MIDGKRLRKLREDRGLSAENMARALSMHKTQLLRYENGDSDPSSDVVVKLALFFEVSSDYLLGLTDDSQPTTPRKSPFTVRIDVTDMLSRLSPEIVARTIKALNLPVVLKDDPINVSQLLREFPPVYVARFLKEMGIEPQFKYDGDDSDPSE